MRRLREDDARHLQRGPNYSVRTVRQRVLSGLRRHHSVTVRWNSKFERRSELVLPVLYDRHQAELRVLGRGRDTLGPHTVWHT